MGLRRGSPGPVCGTSARGRLGGCSWEPLGSGPQVTSPPAQQGRLLWA